MTVTHGYATIHVKFFHIVVVNMTSYLITEQETPFGESYGIVAVSDNETVSYTDVTDRRDRMEALVSLCNELRLEPCHLEDVLEDFMN